MVGLHVVQAFFPSITIAYSSKIVVIGITVLGTSFFGEFLFDIFSLIVHSSIESL